MSARRHRPARPACGWSGAHCAPPRSCLSCGRPALPARSWAGRCRAPRSGTGTSGRASNTLVSSTNSVLGVCSHVGACLSARRGGGPAWRAMAGWLGRGVKCRGSKQSSAFCWRRGQWHGCSDSGASGRQRRVGVIRPWDDPKKKPPGDRGGFCSRQECGVQRHAVIMHDQGGRFGPPDVRRSAGLFQGLDGLEDFVHMAGHFQAAPFLLERGRRHRSGRCCARCP
jgi:hypothetical protein